MVGERTRLESVASVDSEGSTLVIVNVQVDVVVPSSAVTTIVIVLLPTVRATTCALPEVTAVESIVIVAPESDVVGVNVIVSDPVTMPE